MLDVSRERLVEELGTLTVTRGEAYVAEGRVRTLVAALGGQQLLATVSGADRHLYQTIVRRAGTEGADWSGQCSCPVGLDCKHTVATVLAARDRLETTGAARRPSWESALAPLVRSTTSAPAAPRHRLALEVSARRGSYREEGLVVLLRPLRDGARSRWVRGGVAWRDLTSPWATPEVDPAQRAALTQLHGLAQGPSSYHLYGAAELPLGDLGPTAWHLLRRALVTGVELVAGEGAEDVTLAQGEAEVALDLARDDDGGLTLRPMVTSVGAPGGEDADDVGTDPDGGRAFLLGRPPHGLARLGEDGRLVLQPLRTAVDASLAPLVERSEPVRVPPQDVERFLSLYYPSLSRQLHLSSRDGSVPAADQVRPRLHLDLTPEPGHVLQLAWCFRYTVPSVDGGAVGATLPLERGPQDPPRDHDAEEAVAGAAAALLHDIPFTLDRGRAAPWPHPRSTVSGRATVRFVTEVLPRLEALEDVEVEVHGELATYEEAQEAPVVTLETSEGQVEDWFDLHVTVSVGGQPVPFEALFAALVRGDDVMMLDSGTWFPLDSPALQELRRLIEEARQLDDREGGLRLTAYQAGLWEDLVRLGVPGQQSARWQESVEAVLALGDADRGTIAVPEALEATLRPYQLDGYRWLSTLWDARLGGVLADDMGLGKTLQVLATVVRAESRGDLAEGPVLVVAPTSVVTTWAEEAARFAPGLRVVTVDATRRRRGEDLAAAVGAADLVVTSYTLLRLEAADYRALPWSATVLDEAQFVKNHRSATYQAVRRVGAARTFAITGTPLENNLMDLWSMFSLAAPGLFPRPELFNEVYRRPVEAGGEPEVLDRLRRRIRPFLLRRTKGEVAAELPSKTEQTVHVDLHPAHRRVYDRHLNRERQRVLGLLQDVDKNRMAIFRALTTLRQLALDPALVSAEHAGLATSAKVAALVQQLRELAAEGHRALVFSSFTSYLALVRAALEEAGVTYCYLDGSTRDRAARVRAFREGDDPAFLISLKAGGFGLNLTEADYVFVLDPWWNPAAEAQAVDRTHRIGQTRPVNVYRMVSTGTIEEKVVALQARKRKLFATVVDSGELGSGRITVADIRGLLGE
ncbi:helicase SNF2 [Ornithinimicrobium avium]|uniref:Helicase SNF2 n=1 Tax=Ornithinimicrobium avium TaxID=2283195 RepID=A0A345NSC3_9MICO|nr:helicase SNF2 [Ornithinimicrobium avium]